MTGYPENSSANVPVDWEYTVEMGTDVPLLKRKTVYDVVLSQWIISPQETLLDSTSSHF